MSLTQCHNINNEDPVFQRNHLKVHRLHPRPQQKVVRHARYPCLLESFRRTATLKICHTRQETCHVYRREDELVAGDARGNSAVCSRGVDPRSEEAVPFRGSRTEDGCRCISDVVWRGLWKRRGRTAAVCEHAPCPSRIMVVEAFLLHGLLSDHIAGCEKNLLGPYQHRHWLLHCARPKISTRLSEYGWKYRGTV